MHRPTRWGSPFPITATCPRSRSLAQCTQWLDEQLARDPDFLEPLRDYDLGCFRPPHELCHADVLLSRLYAT